MEAQHIEHTLEPIFDERSRVLVLGTMPSPKSREVGFYYGHPQNRFWRVMEALFELPDHSLVENNARRAFLLKQRIALWDVLASCTIEGAADASIVDAIPNDLTRIFDAAPHHACLHNRRKGHAAVPAHEWRHAQRSKHCAYRPSIHKRCERSHALEPACRSVSTNCTCRHRRQLPC